MKKHKLAVGLTKFYLRSGRGHGLSDFLIVLAKNIVYAGAFGLLVKLWTGINISYPILVGLAICYEIWCYVLGLIDEKVGFWKFQNNYNAKNLTPFWEEMDKKIDEIKAKL